jgi:hypothetical protein
VIECLRTIGRELAMVATKPSQGSVLPPRQWGDAYVSELRLPIHPSELRDELNTCQAKKR